MSRGTRLACLAVAVITALAAADGTAAASARPGPAGSGTVNWPGFHDNAADTGDNPAETTLGPGNVAGLSRQWLAGTTASAAYTAPTIGGGHVFVTSFTSGKAWSLQAWNATTGAPSWSVKPPRTVSDPAFGDGRLYVASAINGRVYGYNAATGTQDWSTKLFKDGSGMEPVFTNNLVYVSGYFRIGAYSPATGAQDWLGKVNGLVRSVPAVTGGRLFLSTECCKDPAYPHNLYAFNASTGAVLWRRSLDAGTGIQDASPVATGTMVYQCAGSTLYALSAGTGAVRWTSPDGCDDDSTPALTNGVLYVASYRSERIYAINAASGDTIWSVPGNGADGAAPAVANGVLYVPMLYGTLHAYDAATGALLWNSPRLGLNGGDGASEPAVVNGMLYAGVADGVDAFGLGG